MLIVSFTNLYINQKTCYNNNCVGVFFIFDFINTIGFFHFIDYRTKFKKKRFAGSAAQATKKEIIFEIKRIYVCTYI